MERILNTGCLFAWTFFMFNIGFKLFLNPEQFFKSDITDDVVILRWIQTTQILDLILILIGKSKGSPIAAFMQIFGRMYVAWLYLEFETDPRFFAVIAIAWSVADVNRYLYYLFNQNKLAILLRYNLFLVLYPVGIFGEVNVLNDYIKRHAQTISDYYLLWTRFAQVLLVLGMVGIYIYLLKSRSKQMKKIFGKSLEATGEVLNEERNRSRSPKGKRQ